MTLKVSQLLRLRVTTGDDNQNYTQNIDTLETAAGVKRVLQCHGSFAAASCIQCHRKVIGTEIEEEILAGRVPLCKVCNPGGGDTGKGSKISKEKSKASKKKRKNNGWDDDESEEEEPDLPDYPPGIMKVFFCSSIFIRHTANRPFVMNHQPDITFFGEKLTDDFDRALEEDRERVDLVLIIGTSLKVSPVAEAPGMGGFVGVTPSRLILVADTFRLPSSFHPTDSDK